MSPLTFLRLLPNLLNRQYWVDLLGQIALVWKLMRDERISRRLKAIPVLAVLYILSPIDLIPGFIPILGQMDDLGILLWAISAFLKRVPEDVLADYRSTAAAAPVSANGRQTAYPRQKSSQVA